MTLVEDWDHILKRAWSIRCNLLSAVLGAAEVAISVFQPAGVPSGYFGSAAVIISVLSSLARILAQEEMMTKAKDGTPPAQ